MKPWLQELALYLAVLALRHLLCSISEGANGFQLRICPEVGVFQSQPATGRWALLLASLSRQSIKQHQWKTMAKPTQLFLCNL